MVSISMAAKKTFQYPETKHVAEIASTHPRCRSLDRFVFRFSIDAFAGLLKWDGLCVATATLCPIAVKDLRRRPKFG